MASIRARITAVYALAMAGTMFVFSILVGSQLYRAERQDLIDRASTFAALGARILRQAGVENQPITITTDSLVGAQLTLRFRGYLDAVPDYLFVLDSTRVLYSSPPVQRLSQGDLSLLTKAASQVTPRDIFTVTLDSLHDELLLAGGFEGPRGAGGVRRVVAGVSTRALATARTEVFLLALLVGPVILLVSVGTAWLIAGNLLRPVEQMVNDVEAITDGRSLHRRISVEDRGDEIGRLGHTLNAMIERLEASFAALRRFTGDASHELKTPLSVLRADVERAMDAPPGSTELAVALEEALQETARMASLVDSLLTLARADEGRFDLHREPVALEPLVHDVAETAHILGEQSGLEVRTPVIEPVSVLGDTERLRQLFLNLVTNAIKYTAKGGSVDISLQAKDGVAVFTVKDTGIGIAGADLPFVFDRFWRVDRARSRSERGGAGLGLAISQWIAQAHGGSISVASRLGRGSSFTVTMPAMREPSARA